MNKLQTWEIDTLIEFGEEFVKAIVTDTNSEHVEDAVKLGKARGTFRNYMIELFGEEEDG